MVEWKKLGDVCEVVAGGDLPKKYIKGCNPTSKFIYPIYSNGIDEKSLYGYSDTYRFDKPAVTISARGTIGFHTIRKSKFTSIVRLITLIPHDSDYIDLSYLNEVLYITNINGTKGGIPQLTVPVVSRIEIPIPSKSEQERIVSILDTFTSSIANLKEQIKERRKQYEYYRHQLLNLEGKEGMEWKELGEVCEINRGVRVVKKNLEVDGLIPVYQNSLTPLGYYENSNYPANTTFVISAGAAGEIGFSKTPFWAADDCLGLTCPDGVLDKYVFAFLKTKQMYLKSKVRKASVPRLSRTVVEQLQIPLPSLQTQSRIVTIIDEFESSIANLESQLKEREKQYEYYRNQLLTFE